MVNEFGNIVKKMQDLECIKIIAKENNFNLILDAVEKQLIGLLENLSTEVLKENLHKEKQKVDPKA